MILLRWVLGLTIVLLGGGFVVLGIVASGFRKSFGASDRNPVLLISPIAGMVVLLAGLAFPSIRLLLHAGAVVAVALTAYCVWQMITEAAVVLWLGVAHLVAWLAFYGLAVWRSLPPP